MEVRNLHSSTNVEWRNGRTMKRVECLR